MILILMPSELCSILIVLRGSITGDGIVEYSLCDERNRIEESES